MSLHSITCAEFETLFDEYVDEMLEPLMADAVSRHLANCPACDREVTRWQQTRILLSTAVTDFVTAVDVGSVRRDVVAALGLSGDELAPRRSATREASVERGIDAGRSGGRSARRSSSAARRGFAAAWRFASAATVSAVAAAIAVLLLTPGTQQTGTMVASPVRSTIAHNSYQPATFRPGAKGFFAEAASAAYAPPPLARPEISHVDGLEAAPGHFVSTWVQPRTNARVIWVQDRGLGAPVRTAGLDR